MKAIIFADRLGSELMPLTEKLPVALLPIATKPLLEYILESLLVAGIEDVLLVISSGADLIETHLGHGQRWNIKIDYMLSRGEESPHDVLTRMGNTLSDGYYLLLRGDVLSDLEVISFLRQTKRLLQHCPDELPLIAGAINEFNAGIACWNKQCVKIPDVDFLEYKQLRTPQQLACPTVPIIGQLATLDSLNAFHHTNMQALAGEFSNLVLAGYHASQSLWIGRSSNINIARNKGIVGECCRVHPEAHLAQQVILNHNSIVDCGSVLENTVVMPATYVGKYLNVKNAIVSGNYLIRVDTNTLVPVIDSFILTDLSHKTFAHLFEELLHRGLALVLLCLSLPLQLLLGSLAYWKLGSPMAALQKSIGFSNHHQFNAAGQREPKVCTLFEWKIGIPWIRHLPKLWAVVCGDLRLIGIMPRTPSSDYPYTEIWEKTREEAPLGLLSPRQLVPYPAEIPDEEQLLIEIHYARTRNLTQDIYWMCRAACRLFSKTAWRSA